MSPKPFDFDRALAELRTETPSPEARLRARQALRPRPRLAWRWAAVTGAVAVLLLPLAFRTRGSEAAALTVDQVGKSTLQARYILIRDDIVRRDGSRRLWGENRYGPRRLVERRFFLPNGHSGLETRRVPGFVFERLEPADPSRGWKPYETVRRSSETFSGTEERVATSFEDLKAVMGRDFKLERLPGEAPQSGGRTWIRYRLVETGRPGLHQGTWTIEYPSQRLIRSDTGRYKADAGKPLVIERSYYYFDHLDDKFLGIPPLGKLPRFDLDRERAEMDRLNRVGDRTAVVNGQRVKLVGVFQEVCAPEQPVYVAYEGKGVARAKGLTGGGLTTMKSIPPKVIATVFKAKGPLETLDVEIPVGKGYVTFKSVKVRPVSEGIRSALRTPPYD